MTTLATLNKNGLLRLTVFCTALVLVAISYAAAGMSPPASVVVPVKPAGSTTAVTPAKTESHPLWSELTPPQRVALAPLESEWSKIDTFRKKKWLQISSRFASMKPEEQQRLQEKMRIWAKLTPDQRRHAREVYSRTKSLDAEQKSAEWQQYQQLPETEKNRLAKDIAAKKHVANLPTVPASPAITPPKVLSSPLAKNPAAPVKIPASPGSPAASDPAVPAASAAPAK